jgi:large subunit ribosomal protein L24
MPQRRLKIRSGDEVLVIGGKDRSTRNHPRRGKVIGVLPGQNRVMVDGINIIKRAVRQSQKVRQGGIIESPGPIDVSNVMLICPSCEAATRIAVRRNEHGAGVRVCKKCNRDIDE